VLFLFVVMMLDVNFVELRARAFRKYLPIGALIGGGLLHRAGLVLGAWTFGRARPAPSRGPVAPAKGCHNTEALGQVLYTDYVYLFQMAGLCCWSP
jgi:NADH-quinone oxidoreductase subunit J